MSDPASLLRSARSVLGVLLVSFVTLGAGGRSLYAAAGAVTIGGQPKTEPQRKPPASIASLPAPKASGPLRILLIDDDASRNNYGLPPDKEIGSDEVYRELVAAAVGGKAEAWSVE